MLKPLVSIVAPPACTPTVIDVLLRTLTLPAACRVPPLKLKYAEPPEPSGIGRTVLKVPPLRLIVLPEPP